MRACLMDSDRLSHVSYCILPMRCQEFCQNLKDLHFSESFINPEDVEARFQLGRFSWHGPCTFCASICKLCSCSSMSCLLPKRARSCWPGSLIPMKG